MTFVHTVTGRFAKKGDDLQGTAAYDLPGRKPKNRAFRRPLMSERLQAWFATAQDGDAVDVAIRIENGNVIEVGLGTDVQPARPEDGATPPGVADASRASRAVGPSNRYLQAVQQRGGAVNPYTFVPAPPRGDLTDGLGPTGLGDAGDDGPPSHAVIDASQWTGTLRVSLTTVTPLLLLDDGTTLDRSRRRCHGVRLDGHRRPLLHGASLKGALRSAFETVTASRYGVFGPHSNPLAFRLSTDHGVAVRPAIVYGKDGDLVFRLCGTETQWNHPPNRPDADGPIQPCALLTAYGGKAPRPGKPPAPTPRPKLHFPPELGIPDLHGKVVAARLRLYRMGSRQQDLITTWVVTDLIDAHHRPALRGPDDADPPEWGPSLKIVKDRQGMPLSAIVTLGVVCATGRSIDTKKHERFFPLGPPFTDLALDTTKHQAMWDTVLDAYEAAARYHHVDTAAGNRASGTALERSWHVRHPEAARALTHGTPVWVELSADGSAVVGVHPVMIGRKPFGASPETLLPDSLHPAGHENGPARLSPADRLFGWTPSSGRTAADSGDDRRSGESVGYKGQLSIVDVRCETANWHAEGKVFRCPGSDKGMVLSPLSAPKPTQFRFYSAANDHGDPWPDGVPKGVGYSDGSGLRGRKVYRWRKEHPDYWRPDRSERGSSAQPCREYLALTETNETQTIRVTDWVRPGVTFTADLRLDGVPPAELGALLWLLSQGDKAPLRLGHAKPLGFGVVSAEILWSDDATCLRNGAATAARWRSLSPSPPATRAELEALAHQFAGISHPLLRQARENYLTAMAATEHPVRYPHAKPTPEKETFTWFVDNERLSNGRPVTGWSLPHVTSHEQRLPHSPPRK
ncbi:MAG: hypothetical protein QG608_2437 [Actinomycetota bacterium]|nr:hypothetical protein [Actinomycetota bacterium]